MNRVVSPEILPAGPLFYGLPEPLRVPLLALGLPRKAVPGQRIVTRDQPHSGLYCIVQGSVDLMNAPAAGQDCFLLSLDAPAWFGELGLFDGGPHPHEVRGRTPCAFLFFPRDALLALLAAEPGLWCWLGKLLSLKLRLSCFALDELSHMSTETKLARHVLVKAAGFGTGAASTRDISIQQEHLAHGIGVTRASITPILQDWRRRGIVQLRYAGITLLDLEQLKSIAAFSDWPLPMRELLTTLE